MPSELLDLLCARGISSNINTVFKASLYMNPHEIHLLNVSRIRSSFNSEFNIIILKNVQNNPLETM